MPRLPRIEIPGYYHIVNRGVERRKVFHSDEDFEYFLNLIIESSILHNVIIHNYCLMDNHYHLLLELKDENLSRFMQNINSSYANYFNKKYQRSGHLWQGRFKSWYVTSEAYLFTLIRYIEYNPIKAKIVKSLKDYKYSSYHQFFNNIPDFLQNSWIVDNYKDDIDSIERFFESEISLEDLNEMQKASSLVETSLNKKELDEKYLINLFKDITDIKQRNKNILEAYKKGYSQYKIAKVLNVSQPAIAGVIKRNRNEL